MCLIEPCQASDVSFHNSLLFPNLLNAGFSWPNTVKLIDFIFSLESLVLIGGRIRAIREVKKLAHNGDRHRERSACRTGAACSGIRGGRNRIRAGGREEGAGIYPECRRILPRLS